MIRRDDFYIQVFESVYTKKQEKKNKPKLVINHQHRALVSSQQHFWFLASSQPSNYYHFLNTSSKQYLDLD